MNEFYKIATIKCFLRKYVCILRKINLMHLGKNIERICKLTGIKQSDLAKRLNTNQQEISRIENKAEIKDELLERIAKAIGFPKEVIMINFCCFYKFIQECMVCQLARSEVDHLAFYLQTI